MILKKANQIQKITAAFLLLAMLCINAAKLTHTHAAGNANTHLHALANINPDIKCLICDYELTKDADAAFTSFNITATSFYNIQNTRACLLTPLQVFSSFINRGPPVIS